MVEDDIWWEKEDDLLKEEVKKEILDNRRLEEEVQVSCKQEIQVPDKTVLTTMVEEECETPPTTQVRAAIEPPLPLGVRNIGKNNLAPSEEGPRAANHTPTKDTNQTKEDITLGKRGKQDITVNGISLMDIMKKKNVNSRQKTPVRSDKKKKEKETIVTPVPSNSDIRNYMRRKKTGTSDDIQANNDIRKTLGDRKMIVKNCKEDISECEDKTRKVEGKTKNIFGTKKTFSSIQANKKSVKERIVEYQELSDNKNDECVRSGGRCHTHSCVLVREIVEKKRSSLDKTGKIVWLIGEVTILRCPLALPPVSTVYQPAGVVSGDNKENIATTNKRSKLDEKNQSVNQTQ